MKCCFCGFRELCVNCATASSLKQLQDPEDTAASRGIKMTTTIPTNPTKHTHTHNLGLLPSQGQRASVCLPTRSDNGGGNLVTCHIFEDGCSRARVCGWPQHFTVIAVLLGTLPNSLLPNTPNIRGISPPPCCGSLSAWNSLSWEEGKPPVLGDDVFPHFLPCPFPSTLPFSGRDGDLPSPTTKLGQPSPTSTLRQSPTPAHAFPSNT